VTILFVTISIPAISSLLESSPIVPAVRLQSVYDQPPTSCAFVLVAVPYSSLVSSLCLRANAAPESVWKSPL
jgi:hypothetical protein